MSLNGNVCVPARSPNQTKQAPKRQATSYELQATSTAWRWREWKRICAAPSSPSPLLLPSPAFFFTLITQIPSLQVCLAVAFHHCTKKVNIILLLLLFALLPSPPQISPSIFFRLLLFIGLGLLSHITHHTCVRLLNTLKAGSSYLLGSDLPVLLIPSTSRSCDRLGYYQSLPFTTSLFFTCNIYICHFIHHHHQQPQPPQA